MWKNKNIFLVLILIITIVAFSFNFYLKENKGLSQTLIELEKTNSESKQQKELVTKFLEIVYYGKGDYEEYQRLYVNFDNANSEEEFLETRNLVNVSEEFPQSTENIKSLASHLVAISINKNEANVYWVENLTVAKQDDVYIVWPLIKVDGEWKLK